MNPVSIAPLERELRDSVEGEVRFDKVSRALYSTDASVYQIEPLGVVVPRSRDDIIRIVQICAQVPLPDHGARRRHVAGRPGDRRRPAARHLEVLQPHPRGERRRALGARRAGHRARRAERAAEAARPALRARHLHREPRHHRRHDGQQLQRRALGAVRQDDRSRARAGRRAVRRLASRSFAPLEPGRARGRSAAATRSKRECYRTVRQRRGGIVATKSTGASRKCCAASAATTSTSSSSPERRSTSPS